MSTYLKLRLWVDKCWAEGLGYKSLVAIGILPFLLIPVVGRWWLFPALAFMLLWSAFVGWRGYRLAQANDAHYDRKTKYMLSDEYRSTESSMKARFRKRTRG